MQIQGIQNRLREGFFRNPDLMKEIFLKNKNSLINLTRAKGLAVCLDQSISVMGKTPNQVQVKGLINNFLEYHKEEIFFTDSLSSIYPTGEEFKDTGCGILSISQGKRI
ncbi:hypothetical protein ACP6PL_15560 [Dapis sp. BLCC M126]|uniref:hypothetical protein n=1 Tax=Dapis sp. BLCC M126 TaxID=3400189 RepID=UPI003CF1EF0F